MQITRRVYVSLPADPRLPSNLNDLKWGVVEEIEKLGYVPEILTDPRGRPRGWRRRSRGARTARTTLLGGAAVL